MLLAEIDEGAAKGEDAALAFHALLRRWTLARWSGASGCWRLLELGLDGRYHETTYYSDRLTRFYRMPASPGGAPLNGEEAFAGGLFLVDDGNGGRRHADPAECGAEILRLRTALRESALQELADQSQGMEEAERQEATKQRLHAIRDDGA